MGSLGNTNCIRYFVFLKEDLLNGQEGGISALQILILKRASGFTVSRKKMLVCLFIGKEDL